MVISCFGVKGLPMTADIKNSRSFRKRHSAEKLSETDFGILHWTWIVSIQSYLGRFSFVGDHISIRVFRIAGEHLMLNSSEDPLFGQKFASFHYGCTTSYKKTAAVTTRDLCGNAAVFLYLGNDKKIKKLALTY